MSWTDREKLHVLLAVDADRKRNQMMANVGINCPVCNHQTLNYEQRNILDGVGWCETCKTGYQMGRGCLPRNN